MPANVAFIINRLVSFGAWFSPASVSSLSSRTGGEGRGEEVNRVRNQIAAPNAAGNGKPAKQAVRIAVELIARLRKRVFANFHFCAGAVLAFLGGAEIIGAIGQAPTLSLADPIFGLSFRSVMFIAGMIQLGVSFILLFTNQTKFGLGIAAWAAANFLVYRAGLWSMGWHHSTGFAVDPLGLSLKVTDALTIAICTLLFVGSCSVLWLGRRKVMAASSLKMSCPSCGGHIRFSFKNLGSKIPCPHCQSAIILRKAENLKMSCFFCQEHIEFPAHAIGEKMPCPHCSMDITLKEPAMP